MNFSLSRKTLILWQIRVLSVCLIITAADLIFVRYSAYLLIVAAAFVAIGILAAFWYLPAFFRKHKIFVGENSVIVTRGVFVETSHIMPYKRLVFAGGYSTPLARILGLKGITLRAARARILIPEIEDTAAEKLIFGLGGEKRDA